MSSVRFPQLSNAVLPISLTLGGIVIDAKFEQLAKALPPIISSWSGKVISVKLVQLANTLPPKDVKFSGKKTLVREVQPLNTDTLSFSVWLLNLTDSSAVQFRNMLSGISIVTFSLNRTLVSVAFLWNGE